MPRRTLKSLFTRSKKKGSYTLAEGEKSVERKIQDEKKAQRDRILNSRSKRLSVRHRVHIMGGKKHKKTRKHRKTRKY